MKFTVERAVILKSLGHVQSVVEKKTNVPVLSNVRIDANAGKLLLTATDMEISVTESLDLGPGIAQEGATTLPAQMLYDIIRKLPENAEVEIEELAGSNQTTVRAGKSKFKLLSLPVDSFPVLEQEELPVQFTLSHPDLTSLLDKVRFAISNEDSRHYLNGIYIHAIGGDKPVLRSVATDGHRLAHISVELPQGAEAMPGVIIPKKTVAELRKLLADHEGGIDISLSGTKIKFTLGEVTLVSKLIDGSYPDYSRVVPVENDMEMQVNAEMLTKAVDRVSTISQATVRAVKFSVGKGGLVVSAQSPDGSNASEELEASYVHESLETGFNFRYLLDILQQIEGDNVEMIFAKLGGATIVKDPENSNVLYVLMPVRV